MGEEESASSTYCLQMSDETSAFEADGLFPILRDSEKSSAYSAGLKFARHLSVNRVVDTATHGSDGLAKVNDFAKAPYAQITKYGRPVIPFGSGTDMRIHLAV